MASDLLRDERGSTDGTEWRLDPADLRMAIRAEPLLPLPQESLATGALRRDAELKESFSKGKHSFQIQRSAFIRHPGGKWAHSEKGEAGEGTTEPASSITSLSPVWLNKGHNTLPPAELQAFSN